MISRHATNDILEGAQYFPVVAILGPRQSGKTTLAQMIFSNHAYLSLEDLDLRSAAINDPRTFLTAHRNNYGIIIDEFQYAPDLLSYIKTTVDHDQKQGYFILTGSQNFLMNQAISQSLAGRVSLHTLLPLSIGELTDNKMLPAEIEKMLFQGSYPALYSKKVPAQRLYKNYFQTYVERDVRALTQVGDLTTFKTFVMLCAARVGQLVNLASLGSECGISDTTVKRWLTILEASYIIFQLRPYHTNIGKRLVKTPKIFFYDTGLLCSLLGIEEKDLAHHPNRGNIFESFIISECIKQSYNQGKNPQIYFWRDKTGHEVDCIIHEGQKLIALEIKSGRTVNQRFFDGIEYWNKLIQENSSTTESKSFVVFAGSSKQPRVRPNLISWESLEEIFKRSS